MTRFILSAVAVVASTSTSFAQPQVPGGGPQRPTFSPYLNLLNNTGSPALNYFGLVLPQQQFQQQAGQLQQQLGGANADLQALQMQNQQLAGGLVNLFLPQTGNVARFNNTGNYFNRLGNGSVGFGGGGGGGIGRPGAGGMQPSFARPAGGGSGLNRPAGGGIGVPGVGGGGIGVPGR